VAVADPARSRCAELAPATPAYASAAELVEAESVDVLVLATPAGTRLADAEAAAAAGLPLLVEKPPGLDATEATALADLGLPVWIGFNRRFDPALGRLRHALRETERLDLLMELRHRGGGWDSHVAADDALLRLGTHLIDAARWLTGSEISRVRAARIEAENADLELELGSGTARLSVSTNAESCDRVEARAPDGDLVVRCSAGLAQRMLKRLLRPRSPDSLVRSLTLQLEELADAVTGAPAPALATAADGVAVAAAVDAARRSTVEDGAWCPALPPVSRV
jgi:myo-inositol 2-dehydrogenase/D-chiro-inositol 1-dehydrogenase